ncbi:MAG: hypothetical protein IJX39_04555 [Clostridia bacterium]|nr:hypothetical protein [Clostridia bacterium]
MTNNYGIPLSVALINRIEFFFGMNSTSVGYRIFKYIWMMLFTIPFLAESLVEFLVLTTLWIIGKFFGALSLIGLLPALLMGVFYTIFNYFFMFLFSFFTLPDLLNK